MLTNFGLVLDWTARIGQSGLDSPDSMPLGNFGTAIAAAAPGVVPAQIADCATVPVIMWVWL